MNSPRFAAALALGCLLPVSHAAEFKIGTHNFTVPEGYTVELAAGSDMVPRPVSGGFDDAGRLYVTDSSGSSKPPKEQWEDPKNRILRLEDTDGDGRFDKSTVFVDKIGFVQGCLWLDGSVYAAAPPSLWKFTDADGDGVAEKREEWFKQGVITHCGNDIHGPYAGLDGCIYWTKGAFERLSLADGWGKPINDKAAHIFRARPDGSGLEYVMSGGMDNPVEVDFLPSGETFFTSTFMDFSRPGTRDGLGHASYGSVFGKINGVNDELKRTGDIFLPMSHFGAGAPSGLCRYSGTALGEDFQDNLFATTFNLHKVTRHKLKAEGATYRTDDQDFLVSDNIDFHPTDVLEDADGSLLVVDTGGWYKLCCPSSQLAKVDVLGGVYRVKRTGAKVVEDPRGLKLSWDGLDGTALCKRLDDPRHVVQQRAVAALGQLGAAAVPALDFLSLHSKSEKARCNAVWALARIAGPRAREAVRQSMNDSSPVVRHAAIKVASLWRDPKAVGRLLAVLSKGDDGMASVAAEALGRIGDRQAVPALLKLAERIPADRVPDKTDDEVFTSAARYLEHSITFALIGIADPVQTSQGLLNPNGAVHRVALMALDQMEKGGLKPETIALLLTSPKPILRQTAASIAARHADWGGALAGHFREQLGNVMSSDEQTTLAAQLSLFARDGAIQELLAARASDPHASRPSREIALRAMADAGVRDTPPSWSKAIVKLVQDDQVTVIPAAINTARALPAPKEGAIEYGASLLRVARHPVMADDVRLNALASLPSGTALDDELFAMARGAIESSRAVATRSSGVTALTRAKLTPAQLGELADALRTTGPLETTRLLAVFEGQTNAALGLKLVGALKESKASSVLRPDTLRPRLAKFPEAVRQAGDELLASLNTDAEKQRAHLDALLAQVETGDVRRGQAIFNSPKAACASCHKIGYLGGLVGPDLTKISEVRSARDLLEAIVYPSASFVRSYEPMVIATRGGEEYTGVLRKEAADEVVLAMGPGTEQHISRRDIAEIRPGTVSIMPQGLDEQLTKQELADLIAFLKNTKWGAN